MKAEVITIGDEILIGQIIDTNSAFIASELDSIGVLVRRILSIPDQEEDIRNTLDESLEHSDIIILTGGLGPTSRRHNQKYTYKLFWEQTCIA